MSTLLERVGISNPYDHQLIAQELINQDKTFTTFTPTGTGKTANLKMFFLRVKDLGFRSIYTPPLIALAEEKFEEFTDLGLRVLIDAGHRRKNIRQYRKPWDLAIQTYERLDSILRSHTKRSEVFRHVRGVGIDEVHTIRDEDRGPNLESAIMKIRVLYPEVKVCALSATVKNKEEVANWLSAKLIADDKRAVPLSIQYVPYTEHSASKDFYLRMKVLNKIMANAGGSNQNVLCFVTSRKRAEKIAQMVATNRGLPRYKNPSVDLLMKKECAYHHAGMKAKNKTTVVKNFLGGGVDFIAATPTLAQGINSPADRVILFDVTQFTVLKGPELIDANRIQQSIGRAGRKGFSEQGYAYILTPYKYLDEVKIRAEQPLEVISRLRDHLNDKVLEWIVAGVASNEDKLIDIAAFSINKIHLKVLLESVSYLKENKFISGSYSYSPTWTGKMTSLMYIRPETVVRWKENIEKYGNSSESCSFNNIYKVFGLCEQLMSNAVIRREDEERIEYAQKEMGSFFSGESIDERLHKCYAVNFNRDLKDKYNSELFVTPGDLKTMKRQGERIFNAASVIFRMQESLSKMAKKISISCKHGTTDMKIAGLMDISGVGLVRAERLFKGGYDTVDDVAREEPSVIASIISSGLRDAFKIVNAAKRLINK
jgi:helicase